MANPIAKNMKLIPCSLTMVCFLFRDEDCRILLRPSSSQRHGQNESFDVGVSRRRSRLGITSELRGRWSRLVRPFAKPVLWWKVNSLQEVDYKNAIPCWHE